MRNGVSEEELIAKAKGERVTLESIEAAIAHEHYFTAADGVFGKSFVSDGEPFHSLDLLTICSLTLWNGWTILGKSACADPANFNEELGRRLARTDAVNQIWPLMGFELKCRLARAPKEEDMLNAVRADQAEQPEEAQPTTGNAEGAGTASEGEKKQKIKSLGEIIISKSEQFKETVVGSKVTYAGQKYGSCRALPYEATDAEIDAAVLDVSETLVRIMRAGGIKKSTGEPDWLIRLREEHQTAARRYFKLDAFIKSQEFQQLPNLDRRDLYAQIGHMEGYMHALSRRLARHDPAHDQVNEKARETRHWDHANMKWKD